MAIKCALINIGREHKYSCTRNEQLLPVNNATIKWPAK
ncbi:hypothetical protein CCACVL1_14848, partial [Corchorus capsularis]